MQKNLVSNSVKCSADIHKHKYWNTSIETQPWSEVINRSLVIFIKAVSVLWCSLKPDWNVKQAFFMKIFTQLVGNNFLQNIWNEDQIGDGSIVYQNLWI